MRCTAFLLGCVSLVTMGLNGCQKPLSLAVPFQEAGSYSVKDFRTLIDDSVADWPLVPTLEAAIEESVRASLVGQRPVDVLAEILSFEALRKSVHTYGDGSVRVNYETWLRVGVKLAVSDSLSGDVIAERWFLLHGTPSQPVQAFVERIEAWLDD